MPKNNGALVAQLQEAVALLQAELADLKNNPPTRVRKESTAGKPRESVTYEILGYFKPESRQPPQCLQISAWAWEASKQFGRPMTEPELFDALKAHEDEWKRKHAQAIWHVWQYYRPRMISAGHVRMS